jgi:hypothetical protein
MENMKNVTKLSDVRERHTEANAKVNVYRFDVFKGKQDETGKVVKVVSVGAAYLREGMKTYTLSLKTFLNDKFYLLPNSKPESSADFVILTRELAQNLTRKYFWNNVGVGRLLDGANKGLMALEWYMLADNVYMNLHPANVTELPEAAKADAA